MNEEKLRSLLPIGDNEKILTTVEHHWFAYVGVYLASAALSFLILGAIIFASVTQSSLHLSDQAVNAFTILGLMFIVAVVAFSFIPVWIRKQEKLVLTEEALVQIKKPSLFASKISQLNLQHIADVTVQQNTLGSMLGFSNLTVETPGEQDNYEFSVVGDARNKAKMIIEAHENYAAALESGQIQTTLGERPPVPGNAWREAPPMPSATPQQQADPVAVAPQQDWQQPAAQPSQPISAQDTEDYRVPPAPGS